MFLLNSYEYGKRRPLLFGVEFWRAPLNIQRQVDRTCSLVDDIMEALARDRDKTDVQESSFSTIGIGNDINANIYAYTTKYRTLTSLCVERKKRRTPAHVLLLQVQVCLLYTNAKFTWNLQQH